MDFNTYQEKAKETAQYPRTNESLIDNHEELYYNALWSIDNIGNICNQLKKILRDDEGNITEERRGLLDKLSNDAVTSCSWLGQNIYKEENTHENLDFKNVGLFYTTLGLAGEIGELCGNIKKVMETPDNKINDEMKSHLRDEIGDILWYMGQVAEELDLKLDDVAERNLEKLFDRVDRDVIKGSGDDR